MVLTSQTLHQPAEPEHHGPRVSVFLPSYNKGEYVLDAMRSVFNQSVPDWELWILENSNDGVTNLVVENELSKLDADTRFKVRYERLEGEEIERKRRESYITAWLLNVYYPEGNGKYQFYLSDDDLIDPECFELMAGHLDAHEQRRVVYCSLRHGTPTGPGDLGPWPNVGIPAIESKSFPGSVDSRIDGGQIMWHKTCLDKLAYPYYEETGENGVARHSDGIFMERLVSHFPFWPVSEFLVTHRWTNQSVWSKST
jgi:glycosyltransferase involved in cell wall biosynthesis